jgi:hypothetical protein
MDSAKRSKIVLLTLVGLPFGAIAIANAFPGQEMRRNLYPDRASCERDYSPQQCEQRPSGSGGSSGSSASGGHGGGGGFYRGPAYVANRSAPEARGDPGAGRTGQITRTETSVRGGFGSFGRAMRAVG